MYELTRHLLGENVNDERLLVINNELWFSNGVGSGVTVQLTKKTFTDKKGDSTYDPNTVNRALKFMSKTKPNKTKGDTSVYYVPVYKGTLSSKDIDVWGGKIKPSSTGALMISKSGGVTNQKYTVVSWFDKKIEADNWLNSLA